ncbi:replication initiation protein RepC [Cypionkella psychrotolerans]|uniref:replication initiation protein RepC n=1 Tax=Cypionkella psychrotolerans TaxID=1678131 RepID=UPI0009EB3BD3|nr:replication initiation protein RepC [Cypionkella psychrotolerans]
MTALRATRSTDQTIFHPILPTGVSLGQVKELLHKSMRQLGLTHSLHNTLLTMIEATAAAAWHDPSQDVVCYRQQQDLARTLGKSDRALRNDETTLARAGVIVLRTGNDGRRSGRLLPDGTRLGISFAPLIGLIPRLVELQARQQDESNRFVSLRLQASAARRDLRRAIDRLINIAPDHPITSDAVDFYANLPRRYLDYRTAEALAEHVEAVDEITDKALDLLQLLDDTSGAVESAVPAITINTNPNISVSCNGSSVLEMPARKRAEPISIEVPYGAEKGLEQQDAADLAGCKTYDLDWLPPTLLYAMASSEMRFYVEGLTDRGPSTMREFVKAAIMRVPELGISTAAWEAAADAMGNDRAALCVLVIDANRNHPTHPIKSPGGVLRAMSQRHAAGSLNLSHSLIGLAKRTRLQ